MGTQHADLSPTYFTLLIRAKKISGRDTGMVKDNNLEKIFADNCLTNIVNVPAKLVWLS